MIKGTTSSGYKYQIDERIKTDWNFVRKLALLEELQFSDSKEIDFINIMAEIERIIFADNGKSFEAHIAKKNDGFTPTEVILRELIEIIKGEETKNS